MTVRWWRSRRRSGAEAFGSRPPGVLPWLYRRRDRRIVARGGAVPGAANPEEPPHADPFRPSQVDEAQITARITDLAGGLLPGAVDEAIGHALDNLINARVDQWHAQVEAEYAEYRGRARFRQQQAVAIVEQEAILRQQTERRLGESEIALTAAIARLLGRAAASDGTAGPRRVWLRFWKWRRRRGPLKAASDGAGGAHRSGRVTARPDDLSGARGNLRSASSRLSGLDESPPGSVLLASRGSHNSDSSHSSDDSYAEDEKREAANPDSPIAGAGSTAATATADDGRLGAGEATATQWADWGGSDHADPTLLGGRPRSAYVYVVALVAAAVADVTAFYQVLELVMANSPEYLVMGLVAGFTGVVLALAHFSGLTMRDRLAGNRSVRAFIWPVCMVVWLTLGALAFYVRLKTEGGVSAETELTVNPGASPAAPAGAGPSDGDAQGTLPGALVFAGLYAATGIVALVGGYLTHNPLRAAFARAFRAYRSAAEAHAVATRRFGLAEAVRNFRTDELASAERIRDEALQQRLALAEELKQRARLEISRRLQDASVTDTYVKPDARPYTYRTFSADNHNDPGDHNRAPRRGRGDS